MDRRRFLKIFGRGAAASAAVATGVVAVKDLVSQPAPTSEVPYGLGIGEQFELKLTDPWTRRDSGECVIMTGPRGAKMFDDAIKKEMNAVMKYETMTVEKLEEILKDLT